MRHLARRPSNREAAFLSGRWVTGCTLCMVGWFCSLLSGCAADWPHGAEQRIMSDTHAESSSTTLNHELSTGVTRWRYSSRTRCTLSMHVPGRPPPRPRQRRK